MFKIEIQIYAKLESNLICLSCLYILYRRDRAYTINVIFLTVLLAVINSLPHRINIYIDYIQVYI